MRGDEELRGLVVAKQNHEPTQHPRMQVQLRLLDVVLVGLGWVPGIIFKECEEDNYLGNATAHRRQRDRRGVLRRDRKGHVRARRSLHLQVTELPVEELV